MTFQVKNPAAWPAGLNIGPSFLLGDAAGTLFLSQITLVPGKAAAERL